MTGHLAPSGKVVTRPLHLIEIRLEDYVEVRRVPACRHEGYWPDTPGFIGGIDMELEGKRYVTKEPVVGLDGYVICGRRRDIPLRQAVEWAELGLIDDPDLYPLLEPPFDPRTETKPTGPKVKK